MSAFENWRPSRRELFGAATPSHASARAVGGAVDAPGSEGPALEQAGRQHRPAATRDQLHDAADRPTSLPDNDRYWFSTGVQWAATKDTTIDVGYTYLYLRKTDIDTTSGSQATKGLVAGTYDSNAHIFGLQLSSRF